MPRVDDPTDADFGRFMIIELHSKFGDPSKEEGMKPKDPTILDKLITQKEMSGLINKALEGLKRLQAQNWEFSYKRSEAEVEALMLEVLAENGMIAMHCLGTLKQNPGMNSIREKPSAGMSHPKRSYSLCWIYYSPGP